MKRCQHKNGTLQRIRTGYTEFLIENGAVSWAGSSDTWIATEFYCEDCKRLMRYPVGRTPKWLMDLIGESETDDGFYARIAEKETTE